MRFRIGDATFATERLPQELDDFNKALIKDRHLLIRTLFLSCFDLTSSTKLPKSLIKERDQIVEKVRRSIKKGKKSRFNRKIIECFNTDRMFTFIVGKKLSNTYMVHIFPRAVDYNLQFDLCINNRLLVEIKRTKSLRNIPAYIEEIYEKIQRLDDPEWCHILIFFVIPVEEEGEESRFLMEIGNLIEYATERRFDGCNAKVSTFTHILRKSNLSIDVKIMFKRLRTAIGEIL